MATASQCETRLVSVVIPAHNQARMLDTAIESILRSDLIATPEQVVVADDDSNDDTHRVASERGVTYLRVNHHNISRTRNAGLALAQTRYVTFLDHDDAWLPGNMEQQLEALKQRPAAAFAYGIARCADEDLHPLPWTFPWPPLARGLAPEQLHVDYPNLGVVLFKREALLEADGFDPRIAYHQDGDLLIRIAGHHEIVGVEHVGMLHRLRNPSRARADYYWPHRGVLNWRPRDVGVGRKAAGKLLHKLRGIWYHRFIEDARACLDAGRRADALVCLTRGIRVSPPRAARHLQATTGLLTRCLVTSAWVLPSATRADQSQPGEAGSRQPG